MWFKKGGGRDKHISGYSGHEKVIREQIKELAEKEMPDVCAVLYETGDALLAAGKQFMDMFQKQISDMKLLSQKKAAAYYQYSMQAYWDFMNKK